MFGEMIPSRYIKDPANRSDIVREAPVRAPSEHTDQCLVGLSLILWCRIWSKLDLQVVVCMGWLLFKEWVGGSHPARSPRFQSA
jgi:hypothetical protein